MSPGRASRGRRTIRIRRAAARSRRLFWKNLFPSRPCRRKRAQQAFWHLSCFRRLGRQRRKDVLGLHKLDLQFVKFRSLGELQCSRTQLRAKRMPLEASKMQFYGRRKETSVEALREDSRCMRTL